jgi:hypothetical protein
MMNQEARTVLSKAMALIADAPNDLARALKQVAVIRGLPPQTCRPVDIEKALRQGSHEDVLPLNQAFAAWEFLDSATWTDGTERNTEDRRERIFDILKVPDTFRNAYSHRFPVEHVAGPTIIAAKHEMWRPRSGYYWEKYRGHLEHVERWPAENLAVLDQVTTAVVSNLSNPLRDAAYRAKGLVVGYVQSGKTANFTGVIAKAIDSGYRLIVVLAGTIDVLRSQTQRRIDKELVGKEQLQQSPRGNDYAKDKEWHSFLSHGGLPSDVGEVDITSLTRRNSDYRHLGAGIDALEFERRNKSEPLNSKANLGHVRVRLAIVKKNAKVLERLVDDLEHLKRTDLGRVPVLIIDDESDQASINTSNPEDQKKRTAINGKITELLALLPRSQYVGYTATPFANVFVNPSDPHDIFPKDFIVSLPRPKGYMGVTDFFDLEDVAENAGADVSNERAYVRSVKGKDTDDSNFPTALDLFVLAGALKLYRAKHSRAHRYRHHTMLVHSSTFKASHTASAALVKRLYDRATYGTSASDARLSERLDDFRRVSAIRGRDLPFPSSFKKLVPFVRECHERIVSDKAVRIVNGDSAEDTPDFGENPVWSILVGGTKLSRGYTIEGLTTSYYRRTASTADTLMQMGRWFGFRQGYQDLVRLFVGSDEPIGKSGKTLNLLEAFKALCLDEEGFREDLKKYATVPGITPLKVRPLVPFHMLKPTSKNKMRWASLVYENIGGEWREKTAAPASKTTALKNQMLVRKVLDHKGLRNDWFEAEIGGERSAFEGFWTYLQPADIRRWLANYSWAKGQEDCMSREEIYLSGKGKDDPKIERWLFLAPQLQSKVDTWPVGKDKLTVKVRARVDGHGRFKVYSERQHRTIARVAAGLEKAATVSPALRKVMKPGTAVLCFYPVRDRGEDFVSMGFTLQLPSNGRPSELRYSALADQD